MMQDKRMKYIQSVDGLDFYEYKARLFSYFYQTMAGYETLVTRQLRETIDYVRGNYKVIYMGVGNILVGYGVITRGGGRNRFSTTRDIVLCSLYVKPECRGKGYGNTLVKVLSTGLGLNHCNVYEYIRHDNFPSIKVALTNGFVKSGNATYKGWLKSIVPSDDGTLGIYIKDHQIKGSAF